MVPFTWQGERRSRCFVVEGGELVAAACPEVGLGDVVASATGAVGIRPCGGCKKRQEALNRRTPSWLRRLLGRLGN